MKKKIGVLLLLMVFCFASVLTTFAAPSKVVDNAGYLTADEKNEVADRLEKISTKYDYDVFVMTVNGLDGVSAEKAAMDNCDSLSGGRDGLILLIDADAREYAIAASGSGKTRFSSVAKSGLIKSFESDLSAQNYKRAFLDFAQEAEKILSATQDGKAYKKPFNPVKSGVIAFVISIIIAFITTGSKTAELQSVHMQTAATEYVKKGSLKLTDSRERFLYRKVEKKEKPKSSQNTGDANHTTASGKF